MQRSFLITGSDVDGPQEWWADPWVEKPFTDGGRIDPPLDRKNPASVFNQYYEMAVMGRPSGIAIGTRSIQDPGFQYFPLLRDTIETFNFDFKAAGYVAPTIQLFIDTGALGAMISKWGPEAESIFDCANNEHVRKVWAEWVGPSLDAFPEGRAVPNPIRWERTEDGRVLMLVWGIKLGNVRNVSQCNAILNYIELKMVERGWRRPAFVLDRSWIEADRNCRPYAVHSWFDPTKSAYTITEHQSIKVQVMVPSFHDHRYSKGKVEGWPREIKSNDGATLEAALTAGRNAGCHFGYVESYNNQIERASLIRLADGSSKKLDAFRRHMDLTRGVVTPEHPFPLGVIS